MEDREPLKGSAEYGKFLVSFVKFNILPPRAVNALFGSSMGNRLVREALDNGDIYERSFRLTMYGSARQITGYGITAGGMRYILDFPGLSECCGWLGDVKAGNGRLRVRGSLSRESFCRYLNVSCAAVMAEMSGAVTAPVSASSRSGPESHGKDDGEIFPKVREAWEKNGEKSGEDRENPVIFKNAYEVKRLLVPEGETASTELQACRYTGIMESDVRTVLVYQGSRFGMSWSDASTRAELISLTAYSRRHSRYRNLGTGESHAVMFMENAAMFERLYAEGNQMGRRPFASGFNSFVILPVSREGAGELGYYMRNDRQETERYLIVRAVESGIYSVSERPDRYLFPLVNSAGKPVFMGIYIDAVRINRLLAVKRKTGAEFTVMCGEWQMDYYSRVLPGDVTYMLIS